MKAIVTLLIVAGPSCWSQQSPHKELSLACESCHTTQDWVTMRSSMDFDHQKTAFPLSIAHQQTTCKACHTSLDFSEAKTDCASCHTDIHRSQFGIDCEACHVDTSWESRMNMIQRHQQTLFPLLGEHARLDCEACHSQQTRLEFGFTSDACEGCHAPDFANTRSPSHVLAGFDRTCEVCHAVTANDWQQTNYQHPPGFDLNQGHSGLDCIACHESTFQGTPTDCFACHDTDYNAVVEPNHLVNQFSTDCLICHNTSAWSPAVFDHNQTQFPLTGAHTPLECIECHADGYSQTPTDCYSCHTADYNTVTDPNHVANQFSTDCLVCHNTSAWSPANFDHNQTQFPLTGAHMPLDCQECHADGYNNTPADCYSCHSQDYENVPDPNHVASQFSTDCLICHNTSAWSPANLDHNQTQFPLTGAHMPLDCQECHADGYNNTPIDCYACHATDYESVPDPNHVANQFSTDCLICHNTDAWSPATFDHNQTQFPLTGAHVPLDCLECHASGYNNTPTDCYACHTSDYESVPDPNHVANQFSTDCLICHNTDAWSPATFDHNQTQFPLTGAHVPLDCLECHASGYNNTPTDCYACHTSDYESVPDPNHVANQFSTDCLICHNTDAWSPATFDHNQTQFPLTGAHVPLDCLECHASGYNNTPTDCYACHTSDYESVPDPNHVTNQFSTDCLICHNTDAWSPATFDHNQTQFPLTGAHVPLDCLECHVSGYNNTPTDCYACHISDYESVPDPNHVTNQFSTDCLICHNTTAWSPATFDHNQTQFPLTGAHVPLDCLECHASGYNNTPTDCYACHISDYESVPDPNHVTNQFSTDCLICHNTTAWSPATFDHNQTQFPLTGAHVPLDCLECHASGYNNTPTDCYACHISDYESVPDPNHVTNQFSTDCLICHNTTAWSPATFDHNQTQFPLTGAHVPLDCLECHASGYNNTPSDCVACHRSDYDNATDPNHVAAQFPTTCEDCHNTQDWEQANFVHMFPLYTGPHRNEWDTCVDCHINPSNYQIFSCIDCHAHPRGEMDDEHDEVNGYVYDSMACYTCHPTGEEDDR